MTFNATGYSIGGGNLTVTAGGITANQKRRHHLADYRRRPQTWTVAAGQTLTVGTIHTVISDLTFAGSGSHDHHRGGGWRRRDQQRGGFRRPPHRGRPGNGLLHRLGLLHDNIVFNGGTLNIAMTGNAFTGGTTVNGGLLQLDASSVVSGGSLVRPLGPAGWGLAAAPCRTTAAAAPSPLPLLSAATSPWPAPARPASPSAPWATTTPRVVTLSNSPVITVTAPTTIADRIVGNCGFTKSGSEVLSLTASAKVTAGPTAVSGGTLQGTMANIVTPVAWPTAPTVPSIKSAAAP